MPQLATANFGDIDYREESVLEFPEGLPAFEQERRFVAIEEQATSPVIFLQSLARADLAFITLPALLVEPGYRPALSAEDLQALGLAAERQPEQGAEVLCLAIITISEGRPPTANLMAPVVVNLRTRRALQAIQSEAGYSHQHPLGAVFPEEVCS